MINCVRFIICALADVWRPLTSYGVDSLLFLKVDLCKSLAGLVGF